MNSTQNKAEKIERYYHTQRKNPRGYCNSKYLCTKHKDIQIHKRNITVGKTTHQPSHLNSDWPQFLTPDNRQVLPIKQRNSWIEQHHKLSGPNSIYRTVHPNTKDHAFSSAVYRVSSKTDYILGQNQVSTDTSKLNSPIPIWPLWIKVEYQQQKAYEFVETEETTIEKKTGWREKLRKQETL